MQSEVALNTALFVRLVAGGRLGEGPASRIPRRRGPAQFPHGGARLIAGFFASRRWASARASPSSLHRDLNRQRRGGGPL